MAENGFGPMAGHVGRIPNFGKTQVNPLGNNEPPACIQNAMMTKDKKPFTYTPGGLDLSQIRTPSMARRLARQRSQEEQEQAYAQTYAPQTNGGGYQPQGMPKPPPPPPPGIPAPPPPPPLVIPVPNSKSPNPPPLGERPEIVIPENPIGMLRKTNSPYHWEAEKADAQRMGPVPKFVEKAPSPLTVKMPPSSFSNQAPQAYASPPQNTNYSYNNQTKQPESPLHRPEALYAHQQSNSPNVKSPTIELLQRQDSQFNKSPQPFGGQSPISNGSPYSPSPNNNWRQPERRESPAQNVSNSPQSPHINRSPFTPNQQYSPNYQNQSPPVNSSPVFHTLPRVAQRNQENIAQNNQSQVSNPDSDPTPWRTNTLNRHPKEPETQNTIYNNQNANQQAYNPPWKGNEANNNESAYVPPWLQANRTQNNNQQQYNPPWVTQDSNNNNGVQENNNTPWRSSDNNSNRAAQSPPKPTQSQEPPRYQSSMSIPVTPRRQNPPSQPEYNNTPPQKEVVYVNQEPVYFCPESPKSVPAFVKTQKEKTKTPPPEWVQRPLDNRRSVTRDLVTPPRETGNQEPEWVRKSNEMQRGIRDVVSPPKYQQTAQPSWSTRPSENRKSLPRDAPGSSGNRVIPIQMEVSSTDSRDQGRDGNQPPHLRIVIGMNPNATNAPQTAPYSQPTQRIMRVLSPQLVRMDDSQPQHELPTLSRPLNTNQDNQPKTRIIPIQIEGGNNGANKREPRVIYHKFIQEGPPRQSKAFRVLQVITGTEDSDHIQGMETRRGFTDL